MKLYILDNDKKVSETIELTPPRMRIGREVDNELNLLVGGISRYHSELVQENGKWYISDLKSTNGTRVNNLPIDTMYLLHEGDLIDIGDQHLRFGDSMPSTRTEIRNVFTSIEDETKTETAAPAVVMDMAKTAQRVELFENTDTVKGQIPLMDSPIMTAADSTAPAIIINLPQNTANTTQTPVGIIFEPVQDNPPPRKEEPKKTEKPELILTPAPADTIINPAPKPSHHTHHKQHEPITKEETKAEKSPSNLFDNTTIFGKKNEKSKSKENEAPKKRTSNLLFYTCIICIPIIFLCIFVIINQSNKPAPTPTKVVKETPDKLIVSYEKKIITRDNVFRFYMLLDQGQVVFMLDDLKSKRHYLREDKIVKGNQLTELYTDIKESDFMSLAPVAAGSQTNETDEIRTMTIGLNNKFKTLEIRNNYAPSSFEAIERSINDFAGEYGLQTISMTPEELKKEADIAFNKAEELFNNRDAAPENLRKALIRYQVTVDYLDQFAPKPQQWTLARKRIGEATDIINKKLKDYIFDFNRLQKLKNDRDSLEVLDRIIPLIDPSSPDFQKYQNIRIKLENKIKKGSKK